MAGLIMRPPCGDPRGGHALREGTYLTHEFPQAKDTHVFDLMQRMTLSSLLEWAMWAQPPADGLDAP